MLRQQDESPESPLPYLRLGDPSEKSLELLPVFSGERFSQIVQYPVIVEVWDRVVGRGTGGRAKRAWLQQFSEAERRLLGHYHALFYRWYLCTGTPQKVAMKLPTLNLLLRAVEFFATVP